jgi:hypothetical protein
VGSDLRVSFRYLIQRSARNGKIALRVVRAGKSMAVELPVTPDRPMLISELKGDYPPYFIYGPLVFSKATSLYLSFFNNNAGLIESFGFIGSPLVTELGAQPDAQREELVVISSPFFPHKLAQGYGNASARVVHSVNGTRVVSLKQLVALLRDLRDEFVVLELENRGGEALVFRRAEMVAATEEILTDNGVRAQGSPDMLEVWRAKPGR